jgi:ankyrin repeat protein
MVDKPDQRPTLRERLTYIVNFAMPNNHTEVLDLVLDPWWHNRDQIWPIRPGDLHETRLLALCETSDLETFKRLLKDAKPHMNSNESKRFSNRIQAAVKQGQADIVKFLVEHEGVDVNEPYDTDRSLFQSRWPAEFIKGFPMWVRGRGRTLLSVATTEGHVDVVKILLDAGARHNNAIEFAARSGSRTLMRLLWEHGENDDDAMQGAFAMAVDREDTAMFKLLRETGVKLADDVRAVVLRRAREEGLESMVRLLSYDA